MEMTTLLLVYLALGGTAALAGTGWSLASPPVPRGWAVAGALTWYAALVGSFLIVFALTFPFENNVANAARNRFIEQTAFGTWGRVLLMVHAGAALLAVLVAFGARGRPRRATAVAIGVSALAFLVFTGVLVAGGRAMGPPP